MSDIDDRQLKRRRLTPPSSQKENNRVYASRPKVPINRKDEQALLDDLMAGLDASVFDYAPSSPTASQRRPSQPLSEKKREKISPLSKVDGSEALGIRERKRDALSPTKPNIPLPSLRFDLEKKAANEGQILLQAVQLDRDKLLVKTENVFPDVKTEDPITVIDDELFEFDFDLSEIAGLDDEVLFKQSEQIRYPVRNPPVPAPPPGYSSTPWCRCRVKAVLSGLHFEEGVIPPLDSLAADNGAFSDAIGKTAVVKLAETTTLRVVHLKEQWADMPIEVNDIVNIVSTQVSNDGVIVITFKDPSSFVIHHPDLMLTMTAIANSMPCSRKPILQSLVRVAAPSSKAMLYGTILHGLLQGALVEQDFSIDSTRRRLDDDLKMEERKLEIWGAGLGVEDVRLEVGAKAGHGFETFGKKWVGAAVHEQGDLHAQSGEKSSLLAVTGLHDIEEDIWSPKWGLKGKVDASVQALIQQPGQVVAEESVAPLEIKTGRSVGVMAHRAQTMLYTLLMEDRYGVPIPAGLLYYSQLDSILRVEAKANEIRSLLMARNDLAHYLTKSRSTDVFGPPSSISTYGSEDATISSFLPPTINNPRECKSCYAVDICMLYRKMVDQVPSFDDDPIAELYAEKTGHLTQKDVEFFQKWETLLTLEEQDIGRFRSQLWTMTADEREKTGRCFSDMTISSYSNDIGKSLAKIHRHSYTFVRSPHRSPKAHSSLLHGHIAKGDPVNISIEPDILCLSRGFVLELTPASITIGVTYVIDTEALMARTTRRGHKMDGEKVVFRIDKDEMTGGLAKMRANLACLFFENGAEQLRKLIVEHQSPRFDHALLPTPDEIPAQFNEDQRKAMEVVLTTQDYSLILGMPGTGKTSTVAEIIRTLVARGKSVLLTSYTHSAVDTILMKMLDAPFGVLRLGNVDKVHPDVRHLTLEAKSSDSMGDTEARLMGPPVVASTCLGIDHPLFFRRRFDYCIVDEASQITLPTCLGPLRLADRFVLVGDHFQLPPIVRNINAKDGGLDVSLFRTLSEAHPQAVVDLSYQYRMNEDIMMLSNKLIYEGRLKCGSQAVAKRSLRLNKRPRQHSAGKNPERGYWIQDLLDESVKAVFVDTDEVPAYDSRVGDLVQNEVEAKLVFQLAAVMIESGLPESDMAVITPYRQQIKLLTGHFTSMPKVEILTADKSQGRDKEVILISLVRSNESGSIGDLLKDWRRINVSFTRAKSKLVIFGSRRTLGGDKLLQDFIDLMEGQRWIYRLPKGADEIHHKQGTGGDVSSTPVKVKEEGHEPAPGAESDMTPMRVVKRSSDRISAKREAENASQLSSQVKKASQRFRALSPVKRERGSSQKSSERVTLKKDVAKAKGSLDKWLSSKPLTKDILAENA